MKNLNHIFRIVPLTLIMVLMATAVCFAEKPDISSDAQRFDFSTMRYVLDGHVKVKWSDRVITADHAQVSIPSLEVWAQGNIELHQDDIYFRGDVLHVLGSSDTANITGNARFERDELKISADKASFNWDTKLADFYDNVLLEDESDSTKYSHVQYNVVSKEFTTKE